MRPRRKNSTYRTQRQIVQQALIPMILTTDLNPHQISKIHHLIFHLLADKLPSSDD